MSRKKRVRIRRTRPTRRVDYNVTVYATRLDAVAAVRKEVRYRYVINGLNIPAHAELAKQVALERAAEEHPMATIVEATVTF